MAMFKLYLTISHNNHTVWSLACAQCAAFNATMNSTSYVVQNNCLDTYEVYDKHGIKWKYTAGHILNIYDRRYGRQGYSLSPKKKGSMYIQGTADDRAVGL